MTATFWKWKITRVFKTSSVVDDKLHVVVIAKRFLGKPPGFREERFEGELGDWSEVQIPVVVTPCSLPSGYDAGFYQCLSLSVERGQEIYIRTGSYLRKKYKTPESHKYPYKTRLPQPWAFRVKALLKKRLFPWLS